MQIDWEKLWEDFERWFQRESATVFCKKCKHRHSDPPEWEEQQKHIKRLIERQLRKKNAKR